MSAIEIFKREVWEEFQTDYYSKEIRTAVNTALLALKEKDNFKLKLKNREKVLKSISIKNIGTTKYQEQEAKIRLAELNVIECMFYEELIK